MKHCPEFVQEMFGGRRRIWPWVLTVVLTVQAQLSFIAELTALHITLFFLRGGYSMVLEMEVDIINSF